MPRSFRLAVLGSVLLVIACHETLDPVSGGRSSPAFGDFLVPVDSVVATPNPARQGDTLVIRLFGGMRSGTCVPWTIITQNAGFRVDLSVWGRNRVMPPPCHALSDQPLRLRVNLPGGHEVFTISVQRPGREALVIEVPVRM